MFVQQCCTVLPYERRENTFTELKFRVPSPRWGEFGLHGLDSLQLIDQFEIRLQDCGGMDCTYKNI